ncbi:hypothetical protein Tco_0585001 [Tanacetum coccineum]
MGLWYPNDSGFELIAFSDADNAGCIDTRKSTSGGIQFLGDKLVSWMSKKQDCIAMSSAEAKYVALSASWHNIRKDSNCLNSLLTLFLSALRIALVTRMASAAAKPYQEDSFEFYLITGSIYID